MIKYKTIFISDIHLGTPQCQADKLLTFLKTCEFKELYLVGDIIDMIALKDKWYWTRTHNTIIQKILKLSRKGTAVNYIVGNHDDFIRHILDDNTFFGSIRITNSCIHHTANNRKLLVVHGDQYDGAVRSMPWLYWLGSKAYNTAIWINNWYNFIRRLFGLNYWSLSAYLKKRVKRIIQHINDFENIVSQTASAENVNGVVCGHIHTHEHKLINGFEYINCGDWCESCTAAIENLDGSINIVDWQHNKI